MITEWHPDGRNMTVLESLYVTINEDVIEVPKDVVINGLSTPWIIWRLQPPYVGKARRASVIHDIMCVKRMGTWSFIHWVFWRVCRYDGVSPLWAWILWASVYYCGPGSTVRRIAHWITGKNDHTESDNTSGA